MKITKIKCPYFNHTKSFTVTDDKIILYSGKRAVILNKSFELLGEITGLNYVYNGKVSPDGKNLLLLSNGNCFYVVSLESMAVTKITLKRKYSGFIRGIGCWSPDSKYIFIQSVDNYCFSHVLKYDISNNFSFEDVSPADVQVHHISYVKSMNKYLIVCLGMFDHYWRFLWTDFETKNTYVLEDLDTVFGNLHIDENNRTVNLMGHFDKTYCYDFEGNQIESFNIELDTIRFNFLDVFNNTPVDKDYISKFCELFGMENIEVYESIDCMRLSKDKRLLFIGTMLKLMILDAENFKVLKKINYEYGVRDVCELEDDLILVETYSGVKLLKIER